jgi:hypothetical protein
VEYGARGKLRSRIAVSKKAQKNLKEPIDGLEKDIDDDLDRDPRALAAWRVKEDPRCSLLAACRTIVLKCDNANLLAHKGCQEISRFHPIDRHTGYSIIIRKVSNYYRI